MDLSVGRVKWYGGINRKKGTENKFGFVEDVAGVDVYLHEKHWQGSSLPQESQLVVYALDENNGKPAAQQARLVSLEKIEDFSLFYELLMTEELSTPAHAIKEQLTKTLSSEFSGFSDAALEKCLEVFGKKSLCNLLASKAHWDQNLNTLVARGMVSPLQDLAPNLLPSNFLESNRSKVADYLLSLGADEAHQKAQAMSSRMPGDLVCFALLARLIEPDNAVLESVNYFVQLIYSDSAEVPDYLKQYIDVHIKPKGGVIRDAVIGPIFGFYQFKRYLYAKDVKFVSLYGQSPALQARADTFILKEILSLVLAGNRMEDIYDIFLGKLWGAISNGEIDIQRDRNIILSLFPSCSAMRNGLSCEAFHWEKQNKFLCRGQECHLPKVIPNTSRHYLEFSIYDWFSHYGISYLENGRPSSRDFPIKLAGYFNRLYEIFEVIHCRACSSLMLPDMRYARVEHTVIENGEYVKKDMAPAYRLTVFKCLNGACVERGQGHYINHCLGFDCYQLIDDRDSRTKCDSGLYICNGCGS